MKTVLITGASTGIGRACALHLSALGLDVFATVRNEADAEALERAAAGRLRTLLLDVAEPDSTARAAQAVEDAVGAAGLDGLVNNAGIAVAGPLEFVTAEALRRQLEVNVVGQVAVTQTFLPLLRAARGRIVFMGSIAGRSTFPFAGPYSASKYALEAVTDAWRVELAPWGIEVVIIEPGNIRTPIWGKGQRDAEARLAEEGEAVERLYGRTLKRVTEAMSRQGVQGTPPEAVAKAVEHALLAKVPKTRYLVGPMAYVRALMQLLPDRLRDRLILRQLGGEE